MNYDILFETIAGSHLYGMNTATSDIDRRGVALEPIESLIGLSPFEQHEDKEFGDRVIYGFRKFVQLALEANPNILELLYAPVEGITCIHSSKTWYTLRGRRDLFLSTKIAKTFVGYAYSQAKRMETHYHWMNNNPPDKPNPEDYGRYLETETSKYQWTDYNLKQSYDSQLKEYQQYQTWLMNRNEKRHEYEVKYGYDTKHGSHIVRLLEQGEELLVHHHLSLPRPNAKELLAVRNGSMSYDELLAWMKAKIELIDTLVPDCGLPSKPDFNKIEQMVIGINMEYLTGDLL